MSNPTNTMAIGSPSSTNSPDPVGTKFGLFGYPVLHSASPAFHNTIFKCLGQGKSYGTFSTTQVTTEMLHTIRSEEFGGCSVTMPIKSQIIPYLDDITDLSRATGAVNTVVKERTPSGVKLVGTNTDVLGVRNALLRALRMQHPNAQISTQDRYPNGARTAGLLIGGGATTRSAAYALQSLGIHPIYLINRDEQEVALVRQSFPDLVSKGLLIHLRHPDQVEELLAQPDSPTIVITVGVIPAIRPQTKEERLVYTTVSSVLSIPYRPPEVPAGSLPVPAKRLFLEMAYKPRITPMLQIAAALDWQPIDGIQAMIEQGYAQQRMWEKGDTSEETGSDPTILGREIEQTARDLANNMPEVKPPPVEIDRASGLPRAPLPAKLAT